MQAFFAFDHTPLHDRPLLYSAVQLLQQALYTDAPAGEIFSPLHKNAGEKVTIPNCNDMEHLLYSLLLNTL